MAKLEVTKDFQTFVDGVYIENYQETGYNNKIQDNQAKKRKR